MSAAHILAGAKGGQKTLELYGREFFAAIGATGGRKTWQEELDRDRQLRCEAHKRARRRTENGN